MNLGLLATGNIRSSPEICRIWPEPIHPWKIFLLVFLPSLLITLLVFGPALNAWFVMDDILWLKALTVEQLSKSFTSTWGHGDAYRPLMRLSFAMDAYLCGARPLCWHVHNMILHAGNAAWIFILLGLFRRNLLVRACTTGLFVISPFGHENIAWISGRTHLAGAFLMLGALTFFMSAETSGRRRSNYALSCAFFIMGIMCYEAVYAFPLILTAIFIYKMTTDKWPSRREFCFLAVIFFITLISLIHRYVVLDFTMGQVNPHHPEYFTGLWSNLRSLGYIFFVYGYKNGPFFAGLIVIACLLSLADKSNRVFGLLGCCITISMLLYLPFSPIQGVASRFVYLMQLPLLLFVAEAIYMLLLRSAKWQIVSVLTLGIIVGISLTNSYNIAGDWYTAGDIARSVPEQVYRLVADESPEADLYFRNIPDQWGKAGVFRTYFNEAIRRGMPDFRGRIYRWREAASLPPDHRKSLYFTFDEKIRGIHRITAAEYYQEKSSPE